MNKRKQMSVKEMWKFCLFQAKGYRILPVILVLGMLSGASVVYINSFLYAKILDVLLEEKYRQAATFVVILVVGDDCIIDLKGSGTDLFALCGTERGGDEKAYCKKSIFHGIRRN